jgi:hypothetical protein
MAVSCRPHPLDMVAKGLQVRAERPLWVPNETGAQSFCVLNSAPLFLSRAAYSFEYLNSGIFVKASLLMSNTAWFGYQGFCLKVLGVTVGEIVEPGVVVDGIGMGPLVFEAPE